MTVGGIVAPVDVRRLLAGHPREPLEHLSREDLVDLVQRAGLTGRGGAAFPTARKIRAVGAGSVVVANAMEGEHLSHKDAVLLREAPDLVLDGLELVGSALGARRLILAAGHRIETGPLRTAVAGRRSTVEVHRLDGGFLAGQESALVNRINGRAAVPSDRLRPVWRSGVDGRPTLVLNAETLAQLALLVRHGADWFRSVGTTEDPGTFLVSVSGSSSEVVPRPGVLEIARGTSLEEVLARSRTPLHQVRAVLVGGYHGTWLPPSAFQAPLSHEGLAPYGARPGAGVIHVLDLRHCPLRVSADVAAYLARESAGQCGPCVNGLPRMAETLSRLAARRPDPRLVAEVDRLRRLVDGRGACSHPDGTARFVASTMSVFAGHVTSHLGGECDDPSAR
jgi:NADH:ubiquinone oxidoreductase subunit F (NADH-binding)